MSTLGFKHAVFGAAAALSLSLCAPTMAADHRDAPTIDDYSAIDINDVYMFRDPPNCSGGPGCKLVVAVSTQAVADPQFGSSYHFQENALYRLNFTTRSDAKPTTHINFVFGPFGNAPDCPVTTPGQPAPACQKFQAGFPNGATITGFATQGTSGPTHLPVMTFSSGEITVFAGLRQDPFFFDLVGFNRSVATGQDRFTHVDAFRDKNINAIVVELPVDNVFPGGTAGPCGSSSAASTPCGVWAVTYLGNFNYDDPEKFEAHPEALKQVDRMGNPAVNTALIPAPLKDAFNFGEPNDDPKDFAEVILKQIINLDAKFHTCKNGNTSGAPATCDDRKTLSACFAAATACNPNVPLLASLAVPDILRFAYQMDDGYPNGRLPSDRTTDLLISLILQIPGFTDGTPTKPYCSAPPVFPFLRPPLQLGTGPTSDYDSNPQTCP